MLTMLTFHNITLNSLTLTVLSFVFIQKNHRIFLLLNPLILFDFHFIAMKCYGDVVVLGVNGSLVCWLALEIVVVSLDFEGFKAMNSVCSFSYLVVVVVENLSIVNDCCCVNHVYFLVVGNYFDKLVTFIVVFESVKDAAQVKTFEVDEFHRILSWLIRMSYDKSDVEVFSAFIEQNDVINTW